jgi:ribosomal protein S18 acetylase RimI-like enzyme
MLDEMFSIRMGSDEDRLPLAMLVATVAEERDGIASEPPIDIEALAERWLVEGTVVAVADTEIVGSLQVRASRFGFGEIAMAVAREWRGRGIGSALLSAGIEWSRENGLHKLVLDVFPHNAAAIGLYRKFGFVQEGRRVKQYRRANGEFWDSLDMGLLL